MERKKSCLFNPIKVVTKEGKEIVFNPVHAYPLGIYGPGSADNQWYGQFGDLIPKL